MTTILKEILENLQCKGKATQPPLFEKTVKGSLNLHSHNKDIIIPKFHKVYNSSQFNFEIREVKQLN